VWALSKKFRERGTPLAITLQEVKAIDEAAEVKKQIAIDGAESARKAVEKKYRQEIKTFDKKQKEKVLELGEDPAALAKYIIRTRRG